MKTRRIAFSALLVATLLTAPWSPLAAAEPGGKEAAQTATKPKPYLLPNCLVSDEKLGDMGEPYVFTYKDREIKLCCKECRKDFDKTPAKFIAKLETAEKKGVKQIGPQEFEKLRAVKSNVVLDVRTPKEFAAGHMPGAINIDVNSPEFEKKVAELDPQKTYLVHCAAGTRGTRACEKLQKLNFGQVYNLEGGFKAWEKAGNKSEK